MTIDQTCLTPYNAEAEIDRLLTTALFERCPVYLVLLALSCVSGASCDVADTPLVLRPAPITLRQANLSEMSLQEFIVAAREKLQSACRVSVLADFLVDRFNADVVLDKWMNEVKMPHSTLLHGKSVVDGNSRQLYRHLPRPPCSQRSAN